MNKTTKLNDGQTHRILFTNGKLYLDGIQLAGDGISPAKDIIFEFKVGLEKQEEIPRVEQIEDTSVLKINVHDSVNSKDIGPGQ